MFSAVKKNKKVSCEASECTNPGDKNPNKITLVTIIILL